AQISRRAALEDQRQLALRVHPVGGGGPFGQRGQEDVLTSLTGLADAALAGPTACHSGLELTAARHFLTGHRRRYDLAARHPVEPVPAAAGDGYREQHVVVLVVCKDTAHATDIADSGHIRASDKERSERT